MLPMPEEPQRYLSGLAFRSATNSGSVLAGSLGLQEITMGTKPMMNSVKSLTGW